MSAAAPAAAPPVRAERPVGMVVSLRGISVALMQTLVIPIVGETDLHRCDKDVRS